MAVEIVRSIAFQIVRCAVGPVWSEIGYIIFHRSNVDNLNVQLQTLEVAKRTLQQRVDAAKHNGEKIFVNVQDCLAKVGATVAEANDFQENEGHARVGCLNANLWRMHQQSRKAIQMAKEVSEITALVNEAIKMDKIASLPRLQVALTPSARGYEALHSRTSILDEIMQELKDDNIHMIGVHGMGGVGKSMLIKEVAWQAEHGGSFGAVIVATVTNSPNVRRIQAQLADGLCLKFNEESEEGRARRLWDRIIKENKILVIVDDIWKKIDLTEVGVPFGDEHKGCKLLLTSRNLNVLQSEMGTQKNYRLETLSEEESWNLFKKTTGDVVKDNRIQSIAPEVAKACKGLPLLIVTVAKALKNQDLYAWKDAFIQLTKYDHGGLPSVANEAIELSYKYLGSDQHKSLFLLIALDGISVSVQDLLVYGWGLGLFKNVEWLEDARNKLYKLVDDLKASSLLLEGEREHVSMHDVIREGAAKIATRVQPFFCVQWKCELKEWPEMDKLRHCKHMMLPWCYMSVLPESLDCPELALLVLCSKDNYLKVPDQFFSGMRHLKVLDLGGMMCTPSLPPSLCFLNNLTALYLCSCILEDIAIVSKLTSLEILSLENSEIQEFPKEIGQLTHLRLLNLGNCTGLLLIPANLISSLTALEELYMGNSYIQWEIEGSDKCNNASLDSKATSSMNYNCWGLGLFKNVEWLEDARNKLYRLVDDLKASSLLLEGEREHVSMHDVIREGAAKIATRVQPFFCVQWKCELKEWPEMDKLRHCKHMMLPWCYMSVLPESLDCPELALLVLCSKDNYLKVPDQFFSGMRHLKVLDLGGMMCTPSLPPSLCFLNNLTALYLCSCILEDIAIVSKLTSLEILSLENSEIQELPKEIGQLTHLRLLNLGNCTGLLLIPANLISSLTTLEELYMGNSYIQWEIEGSDKCNNASLGELRHLHRLKSLYLHIQDISNMPRDLLIFGKLENYKLLIGDGWKWSWGYFGFYETSRTLKLNMSSTTTTHLDRGIKMLLNRVEDLSLAEVKGARNVLPGFNGEGFEQLRHLLIQNSVEILYIIDSREWVHPHHHFLNLESLVIRNLINLERICCGQLPLHIFAKLQVIKVEGCERLKNLFSFSVARNIPQLLEIEISECNFMTNVIVEQLEDDFEESTKIYFPNIHCIKLESLPNLVSFSSKLRTTNIQSGSNITEYMDNLSNSLALFDEKVAMPNLEIMKLCSINTAKLWDNFSAPSCIQNLTHLTVDSCGGLKYLFTSSVVMTLVKLQYLKITKCQMVEDIFILDGKLGNLQSTMKPLKCEEVKFPNLETLVVSHMDNLKSIYHDEPATNPFPKLIKMEISFCQKLSSVFPSYMLNNLHNLETLVITNCDVLDLVFETPELNNEATRREMLVTQLKTLTLECLPMLKHGWSNDPRGSPQFQNLCTMNVTNCQSLSQVFPLSVAMELLKLQVLNIRNCGVESIVAKGEMVEEDPRFVFPQLTSLTFWCLEKLESFYPGVNTLVCPSLKKLDVYHCYELEMFKSKSQNYQEIVPFHGHPIFSSAKVIPKIQELSLCSNDVTGFCNDEYCDDDLYIVKALCLQCFHNEIDKLPITFLQRFTNLENLEVACSSFRQILSSENVWTFAKLKGIILNGLNKVEHLCEASPEIQPILQNLETLEVKWCSRLRNVIPSSSSELFQNLNMVRVSNCSGLVNIITSSAARNFLKLRDLIIYDCEMVEEIVVSEDDSDGGDIAFMKLNRLSLLNLPRLTSFCKENFSFKFPLLETLYVTDCPKMETFSLGTLSTPKLRKVQVTYNADGEWHWEGELNATIRKIFLEKTPRQHLQ